METSTYLDVFWGLVTVVAIAMAVLAGLDLIDGWKREKEDPLPEGCMSHTVLGAWSDTADWVEVRIVGLDGDGNAEREDLVLVDEGGWAKCPYCPEMITFYDYPAAPLRPEEGDWFNGRQI